MARYIDAERLKRTFASGIRVYDGMCKIADVMHNIENEPTADVVEVVRCKDCVWFVPEHIKLNDGTTRQYTDDEKKMPCGVTAEVGINVGSYCLRKGYWKENGIPVWFQENDFCSYGCKKDELTKIEHNSLCETETFEG